MAWFPPALFECANGFFHLSYASFRFVSFRLKSICSVVCVWMVSVSDYVCVYLWLCVCCVVRAYIVFLVLKIAKRQNGNAIIILRKRAIIYRIKKQAKITYTPYTYVLLIWTNCTLGRIFSCDVHFFLQFGLVWIVSHSCFCMLFTCASHGFYL